MNKLKQLFAGGAVLTFMSGVAHAEYGLNMPVGVTETSRQVYDLHMLILWVLCCYRCGCIWSDGLLDDISS